MSVWIASVVKWCLEFATFLDACIWKYCKNDGSWNVPKDHRADSAMIATGKPVIQDTILQIFECRKKIRLDNEKKC